VKVIINEIVSAATYEQQKHSSGSDKTYAVWKCKIIRNDFDISFITYNNTINMEAY
jgi:hypothetical protein